MIVGVIVVIVSVVVIVVAVWLKVLARKRAVGGGARSERVEKPGETSRKTTLNGRRVIYGEGSLPKNSANKEAEHYKHLRTTPPKA